MGLLQLLWANGLADFFLSEYEFPDHVSGLFSCVSCVFFVLFSPFMVSFYI